MTKKNLSRKVYTQTREISTAYAIRIAKKKVVILVVFEIEKYDDESFQENQYLSVSHTTRRYIYLSGIAFSEPIENHKLLFIYFRCKYTS